MAKLTVPVVLDGWEIVTRVVMASADTVRDELPEGEFRDGALWAFGIVADTLRKVEKRAGGAK